MSKPQARKSKAVGPAVFKVDASVPVNDKLIEADKLEKYLQENLKVKSAGGVKGKLGENVKISRDGAVITVEVNEAATGKRQLKYLTRRYIRKQDLSNYLRVIAPEKSTYKIKYLAATVDEEDEGEDVE